MTDKSFVDAWNRLKGGWFPNSQNQFPHGHSDPPLFPSNLVELIEAELKGGVNTDPVPSPPHKTTSNASLLHAGGGRGQSHRSTPDITLSSAHPRVATNQIKFLECWHAHTRCVSLSFVADLSHEATLHTKHFVNDFPFSLWIFQPKKYDEILSMATPTDTPTPEETSTPPWLPSLYVMVDIFSPIALRLEHLQFLFLMRLRDSFQGFKNQIMKYFSIDSLLETQDTEAFHMTREDEDGDSVDEGEVGGEGGGDKEGIKGKLKAAFTRERTDSKVKGDYVIAGVNLAGLEVSVMLPSLTRPNKKRRKGGKMATLPPTATEIKSNGVISTGSDQSPASSSLLFPLEVSVSPPTPSPPPLPVDQSNSAQSVPELPSTATSSSPLPPSLSLTELPNKEEDTRSDSPKEKDNVIPVNNSQGSTETTPTCITSSIVSSDSGTPETPPTQLMELGTPSSEGSSNHQPSEATPPKATPSDEVDFSIEPETIKPHLLTATNDLKSPSMTSTGSSTASSFIVPEYILLAKVGVVQGGAMISSEGIGFKAAVRSVELNEMKEEEYKVFMDKKSRGKRSKEDKEESEREDVLPVIKARVELGQSVKSYFPDEKRDEEKKGEGEDEVQWPVPEGVVFLKVNGLKPSLWLKNTMIMKDFFDDEFESEAPIPMQIRITETQVSLKDAVSAPLLHPRNLTVNIPDLFVNRGPRAHNTNLLTAEGGGGGVSTPVVGMATPLIARSDRGGFATPVGVATPLIVRKQDKRDEGSLDKEKFLQSLINHLKGNGLEDGKEKMADEDTPQKLHELIKEIQSLLETPPPNFTDSLSCDFYTNLTSDKPHPTVERLQSELEALRKENEDLKATLSQSRQEGRNVAEERAEVVKQLVKVQMEHATLQLAHEKQLTQIDRLVTERGDLQERLKQFGIS